MSRTEEEGAGRDGEVQNSPKRKRSPQDDDLEIDINAPEPPSKKALRKAKKQKTEAKAEEKHTEQVDTIHEASANSAPVHHDVKSSDAKRSGYGIWIGNLSFTTTKDDLITFISSDAHHAIRKDQITRVHLPSGQQRNGKPQNKGFAYIDFTDEKTNEQALELSEKLLDGRRVLIKDAKNFEGRPEKKTAKEDEGKTPSHKIFVGNLGFDTSVEDLERHFEMCGKIQKTHMATFEDTGKCKGYAWIEFEQLSAAQTAMRGWLEREAHQDSAKMSKRRVWLQKMNGRTLRMEYAEDATTRYHKRHGKNTKKDQQDQSIDGADGIKEVVETPLDTKARDANRLDDKSTKRSGKAGRYEDATVKRLTGAITESQGKKVVFD